MKKSKKAPLSPEHRRFLGLLLALTVLTLFNLLFTASMAGLLGGILILVMVCGIKKGDYPLTKGLSIFLFVYAAINLVVFFITVISGAEARTSALVWLFVYSVLLVVFGILLRNKKLQEYLKTAPQPEEKEKKISFFHGGWRDL